MIPYEKLSAALDAHRRRVRGEPEPQGTAEPEIVDASDLVAEEDSWIEPADESVEPWQAEQEPVESTPPLPQGEVAGWDPAEGQPVATDEWQQQPAGEPDVPEESARFDEPLPLSSDEWAQAPAEQEQAQWPEEAAGEQAQAEEAWPEEPPISPSDFAPPERVEPDVAQQGAQEDEWAIPTVPPAPESPPTADAPPASEFPSTADAPPASEFPPTDAPPAPDVPPAPQDLPPPPATAEPTDSAPTPGQPARTIFGMPAPPTQPPTAPNDQQAGGRQETDDLVIVDEDPDNQ